jgi:hypothetical protein
MAMSGLTATIDHAAEARYRERRAAADRPQRPELQLPPSPTPANDSGDGFDAAYFGRRFKSDLWRLKAFDGAEETAPAADPAGDSALIDFFGHLSLLLVAVRAGDLGRAQAAADALALDALVELSAGMGAGGLAALLGELVSHLAAPISRDDDAGLAAAHALADDLHAVASGAPGPDPYADEIDDGQAAYDTLAHFREDDPGAV